MEGKRLMEESPEHSGHRDADAPEAWGSQSLHHLLTAQTEAQTDCSLFIIALSQWPSTWAGDENQNQ